MQPGMVVKITTTKLGEKYCTRKGVVDGVTDRSMAMVTMIDSGDRLFIDSHSSTGKENSGFQGWLQRT